LPGTVSGVEGVDEEPGNGDQPSPWFGPDEQMSELHAHLGGSVPAHILWEIAHTQGISLPTKEYWEFAQAIRVGSAGVAGLDGLDEVYHLCERIQSSPAAIERSVHAMIGGAYRNQRICTLEVRFNPAKRNRRGEADLDHIILAAARAVDRARLEYPQVRAGLVLMMDRCFDRHLNEVIVDKALAWRHRGVVGVDIAGPRPGPGPWPYADLVAAVDAARAGGLGVTIHCGEEGAPSEIGDVVEALNPDRVGHGVLAATDPALVRLLAQRNVTLELCPTSNLRTQVFADTGELRDCVKTLLAGGVPLTVSTDGSVMMRTTVREEHDLLVRCGAFSPEQSQAANALGHQVSFVDRFT
jgi:adenosine deaminase